MKKPIQFICVVLCALITVGAFASLPFASTAVEDGEPVQIGEATETPSTEEPTTEEVTSEEPTTEEVTTEEPTTEEVTSEEPTTEEVTTEEPTTEEVTTEEPTTEEVTSEEPTTEEPTTQEPTTAPEEKSVIYFICREAWDSVFVYTEDADGNALGAAWPGTEMSFVSETNDSKKFTAEVFLNAAKIIFTDGFGAEFSGVPGQNAENNCYYWDYDNNTLAAVKDEPATEAPTTEEPTTEAPTTEEPTTEEPTTEEPTTEEPTTEAPTTEEPTTEEPTTEAPTTQEPTTEEPTTQEPTTAAPTTAEPTTAAPTTAQPTTAAPTTVAPTTAKPTVKPTTPTVPPEPSLKKTAVTLKAGQTNVVPVLNAGKKKVTYKASKPHIASVKNGVVTAYRKGLSKITVQIGTKRINYYVTVKNNPTAKIGGKAFSAKKTYSVRQGQTLSVQLVGKAKNYNNSYSSSKPKTAKVVSGKTAETVKIKGVSVGGATVRIVVNGWKLAIKIKVNYPTGTCVINGMGVGTYQKDGSILFKMQKDMASNGRALNYLLNDNTPRTIVLPKKKINIERTLWFGSNKTVIATGATIFENVWGAIALNKCTKTDYKSTENITIKGGKWTMKNNDKPKSDTSTFRFAHAGNIKLIGCDIDTNYICHAVELIACKNVTIEKCKLIAKGKMMDDIFAEPLQIDIATPATAPQIKALYGSKFVNGATCQNITVKNCTVKGSRGICTNKTDTEGGKWLSKHHKNIKIIGCTVTGVATEALCLHNVAGVTVQNTKTYSLGGDDVRNSGCLLASYGYTDLTAKYENVFSGNTFKGGSHGLKIKTYGGNSFGKTTVANNKLYAKNGAGAALEVSNCTKTVIKGNKTYGW